MAACDEHTCLALSCKETHTLLDQARMNDTFTRLQVFRPGQKQSSERQVRDQATTPPSL